MARKYPKTIRIVNACYIGGLAFPVDVTGQVFLFPDGSEKFIEEEHRNGKEQPDFFGLGTEANPTEYKPGTPEKIAVMAERYKLRQRIFSKQDAENN